MALLFISSLFPIVKNIGMANDNGAITDEGMGVSQLLEGTCWCNRPDYTPGRNIPGV